MRKTQDDELQFVILVLETKEKTLTFKVRAPLDVLCQAAQGLQALRPLQATQGLH
jgi:hypothetical protein